MRRSIIALVFTAIALGIGAQAASAATRFVAPTGSDATNACVEKATPCATIQHAVDEAGALDTVEVAAGTYKEDVTIGKSVSLQGPYGYRIRPPEPQAIIDAGTGTGIAVEAKDVTIEGMEVSAAGAGVGILATSAADELQVASNLLTGGSSGVRLEGGKEQSVGANLIESAGVGVHLVGAEYTKLSVSEDVFDGTIGEYAVLADDAKTIIEGLTLADNRVGAPVRLLARTRTKELSIENRVSGNEFDSTSGPLLAVAGNDLLLLSNGFDGHGSAGCLEILGEEGARAPAERITVADSGFTECDPFGVELDPKVNGVEIRSSEFPGSYDGVLVSDEAPWTVTGRAEVLTNRIVGTTHLGVDNLASGTLDAEQNWWGCNGGPGSAGCDGVSGGVDAEDNAVLAALIGPIGEAGGFNELPTGNSIALNPGEQAKVAALLLVNGLGAGAGIPTAGVQVSFSSALGTLSPESQEPDQGIARSIFTAGATPGSGSVVLEMDNAQTNVPVTIRGGSNETPPPPPPETPPGPRLSATSKRVLVSGPRASVGLVSCAIACKVTPGTAMISIGGHRYKGKATPKGRLGAESTKPIRVALPASAQRALKRGKKGQIRVKVSVTDTNGRSAKRTFSVKISG